MLNKLAQGPAQRGRPSYGHVSLGDMINFSFSSLYWAVSILKTIQRGYENADKDAVPPSDVLDMDLRFVIRLRDIADEQGLSLTVQQIDRFERDVDFARQYNAGAIDSRKIAMAFDNVFDAFHRDIADRSFFHYEPAKAQLFQRALDDWADVITAFPSSRDDVLAASDCYALGYHTASIYHSMMILELGLPAFARRLKIQIKKERATWLPIIGTIQGEIDRRRRALAAPTKGSKPLSARHAQRERQTLEAFELAAVEFKYFASIWRNHMAHGRGCYDENDAKKVLDHVRAFMEVLARQVKLRESKI